MKIPHLVTSTGDLGHQPLQGFVYSLNMITSIFREDKEEALINHKWRKMIVEHSTYMVEYLDLLSKNLKSAINDKNPITDLWYKEKTMTIRGRTLQGILEQLKPITEGELRIISSPAKETDPLKVQEQKERAFDFFKLDETQEILTGKEKEAKAHFWQTLSDLISILNPKLKDWEPHMIYKYKI